MPQTLPHQRHLTKADHFTSFFVFLGQSEDINPHPCSNFTTTLKVRKDPDADILRHRCCASAPKGSSYRNRGQVLQNQKDPDTPLKTRDRDLAKVVLQDPPRDSTILCRDPDRNLAQVLLKTFAPAPVALQDPVPALTVNSFAEILEVEPSVEQLEMPRMPAGMPAGVSPTNSVTNPHSAGSAYLIPWGPKRQHVRDRKHSATFIAGAGARTQ